MLHLKACQSVARKVIRAGRGPNVICKVYCEGSTFTTTKMESQIIDAIFAADETTLEFLNLDTGEILGVFSFVLEFDSQHFEVIQDYTENDFCESIMDAVLA